MPQFPPELTGWLVTGLIVIVLLFLLVAVLLKVLRPALVILVVLVVLGVLPLPTVRAYAIEAGVWLASFLRDLVAAVLGSTPHTGR